MHHDFCGALFPLSFCAYLPPVSNPQPPTPGGRPSPLLLGGPSLPSPLLAEPSLAFADWGTSNAIWIGAKACGCDTTISVYQDCARGALGTGSVGGGGGRWIGATQKDRREGDLSDRASALKGFWGLFPTLLLPGGRPAPRSRGGCTWTSTGSQCGGVIINQPAQGLGSGQGGDAGDPIPPEPSGTCLRFSTRQWYIIFPSVRSVRLVTW